MWIIASFFLLLLSLAPEAGAQVPGLSASAPVQDAYGYTIFTPDPIVSGNCGTHSAAPTTSNTCIWYVDNTNSGGDTTCSGQQPPVTQSPTSTVTCQTIAQACTQIGNGPNAGRG